MSNWVYSHIPTESVIMTQGVKMKNENNVTVVESTEVNKMNKLSVVGSTPAVIFNVEKVKLNKLPRRFELEGDHRKVKQMTINGKKVNVMIRPDETEYVAFSLTEKTKDNIDFVQHYYVRNHKFFEYDKVVTYTKPVAVKVEPKTETAEVTA